MILNEYSDSGDENRLNVYVEGTERPGQGHIPYSLPFPLRGTTTALRGVHAPNAPFVQDDYCRIRVGGFTAIKVMPYHTEADVIHLRAIGVRYFLMRLPDSVDGDRWKGDTEYANECIALIKRFYPLGVRDFQVDNEPNLSWGQWNADKWRWLMDRVMRLIRQSADVPRDVRLGLAPLAWNPSTWATVQTVWIPEQHKIKAQFDWYAVHSYWQKALYYNSPSFGGNVTHWHDALLGDDKPYVITEWGSSIHEVAGVTPEQVEAARLEQYPRWLEWVETKPYVESSFLFLISGTDDWRGFWPSDKVLRAMAT